MQSFLGCGTHLRILCSPESVAPNRLIAFREENSKLRFRLPTPNSVVAAFPSKKAKPSKVRPNRPYDPRSLPELKQISTSTLNIILICNGFTLRNPERVEVRSPNTGLKVTPRIDRYVCLVMDVWKSRSNSQDSYTCVEDVQISTVSM